jgi:hypothetical protein
VVNVVYRKGRLTGTQLQKIFNAVNYILDGKSHLTGVAWDFELAIETKPPDLSQTVAILVEELLVKELPGLLQLRRVSRTKPTIDLEQSLFVRTAGVLR